MKSLRETFKLQKNTIINGRYHLRDFLQKFLALVYCKKYNYIILTVNNIQRIFYLRMC